MSHEDKKFSRSVSQIAKSVFDHEAKRIRVDILSDLHNRDTLIMQNLMKGLITEMRLMNVQLSMITNLDSDDMEDIRNEKC